MIQPLHNKEKCYACGGASATCECAEDIAYLARCREQNEYYHRGERLRQARLAEAETRRKKTTCPHCGQRLP